MKLKVTFKGGVVKEFELDRVQVIPQIKEGPMRLDMHVNKTGKYDMFVTSNLIPDVELLDRIEFVN